MASRLLFFPAMSDHAPTLQLRPALRRPVRRREIAIAATVLVASATGGAMVALLQPRPAVKPIETPVVVSLPVPAVVTVPPAAPELEEPVPPLPDLVPVIHDGGLRLVITTEAEPQWVGAPIRVSDHDGIRVVARPLNEIGAARFEKWLHASVRLYGSEARLCTAEVTGLVALGRYAPEDFGVGDPPVDAAAAWSTAHGSHLVAADLSPVDGDCAGALWAQPDRLAEPVRATIAAASAEQTRRASELLVASSEYMEVAGSGDLKVTFEAKIITTETEKLLVASALSEGCADFEPFVTGIYALQADGSLHPVGAHLHVTSIEAAADFDGDGHVEILFRGDAADLGILRRRTGGYQVEAHAEVPIYGCRC